MNLAEPLAHHAYARADLPALVDGDRVLRYAELDPLVRQTATYLYELGIAPGEVVGVALRDTIEHVVLLYALARAGIVMLPLDWRWNADEQQRILKHFGAKLLVREADGALVNGVADVAQDSKWNSSVARTAPARSFPMGDGPLLMSLSSGTTGRPKGPRLTHYQFLRRFWVSWINLGFNANDRFISATPLYFGGGRTFAMQMLFSGASVYLFPPPYDPLALCEEVARCDATTLYLVPTLLRRLLTVSDAALAPMRSLRVLVSSGSALHPEERREIRARVCPNLVEYYSSTEGGGVSYLTSRDASRYDHSVGRPVFAVEVQCVSEQHVALPPGEIGRIRYRGPAVADGFWNDPEATREAFRDGWYYPGDLGTLDEEGFLYIKGRAKDMIIRGGINIYPGDVEAALQAHEAVADAAVVGWPSREFNEEVAAFVILKGAVEPEALRAWCREKLAPYKVPRQVFVVTELPRNTLGKILKSELAATLPQL